jgi:molybdopterin converting factor small subunit
VSIDVPEGINIKQALEIYVGKFHERIDVHHMPGIIMMRNNKTVRLDEQINEGDEIMLIKHMTGG